MSGVFLRRISCQLVFGVGSTFSEFNETLSCMGDFKQIVWTFTQKNQHIKIDSYTLKNLKKKSFCKKNVIF